MIVAALVAFATSTHAIAGSVPGDNVSLPSGVTKPAFFDSHGIRVLKWQRGVGGLNVWQVERSGMRTVFYTTADNKTLVSGVLWDAASGAVQSDAYITPEMMAPENIARINGTDAVQQSVAVVQEPAQASAGSVAPSTAKRAGGVAESIVAVAKLVGVTEGKAAVDKTIYIMFDPRCPHCRNVYDQSRDFVARGGSIKWLPVTVLGNSADGLNRVAAILQAKDPATAMKVVEHAATIGQYEVKPETVRAVAANEGHFWQSFKDNPGAGQPSVPVAFFQDKKGAPQMVSDIDDPALLKRIFGEMGK